MTDIVEEFMKCAGAAIYNDWKLTQWSEEYVIETYVEISKEHNPAVYEFVKLNANDSYSYSDSDSDSYNSEFQDNYKIDVKPKDIWIDVNVRIDDDMTLVQMRKHIENFLRATAMGWKNPKRQITLKVHPMYE